MTRRFLQAVRLEPVFSAQVRLAGYDAMEKIATSWGEWLPAFAKTDI